MIPCLHLTSTSLGPTKNETSGRSGKENHNKGYDISETTTLYSVVKLSSMFLGPSKISTGVRVVFNNDSFMYQGTTGIQSPVSRLAMQDGVECHSPHLVVL